MDLESDGNPARRRRGQELEDALLDAAWTELAEHGYGAFTLEGVAERAGTSRPVINRRWKTREELVVATLRHNSEVNRLPLPDTGTLRGDVIALLEQVNGSRVQAAVVFTIQLGSYFRDTGTTPAELRLEMLGSRTDTANVLVKRAMERGEIPTRELPARVMSLPFDLGRHEFIMTLKPLSHETILAIVDEIFLPLVSA